MSNKKIILLGIALSETIIGLKHFPLKGDVSKDQILFNYMNNFKIQELITLNHIKRFHFKIL